MLNLGFYLERLDDQIMALISQEINRAKQANKLEDVSIFYDNIGPVNLPVEAGFFNATDVWNFTGNLVVFTMPTLDKAIKYINNYNIYYCYGWANAAVLEMLHLLDKQKISVIGRNDNASKNFFRVTNTHTIGANDNLIGLVDTILGHES